MLSALYPPLCVIPPGDGLMDISLSVEEGTLFLRPTGSICSEEALEGPSLKYRGSLYSVNNALAGMIYLVRFCLIPTPLELRFQAQNIAYLVGVKTKFSHHTNLSVGILSSNPTKTYIHTIDYLRVFLTAVPLPRESLIGAAKTPFQ